MSDERKIVDCPCCDGDGQIFDGELESPVSVYRVAPSLLKAAKDALKALNAANQVLGGGQFSFNDRTNKATKCAEYYLSERTYLKKVIARAEGREK